MNQQQREAMIRLKVIASLTVGDKISTRYLVIQRDTMYTKFARFFYSESRINTITFVRNTVDQVINLFKTPQTPALDQVIIASIKIDLKQSVVGLSNLRETYCEDVKIGCEITQIIELIKRSAP